MPTSAVKILIRVALFTGHSIATSGDVICEIYFNKLVATFGLSVKFVALKSTPWHEY